MANQILKRTSADTGQLLKKIEIPDANPGASKINDVYGGYYPYVNINGYEFFESDIQSFEIDATGKLPKFMAILVDNKNFFSVSSLPTDGDIASVRIMSRQKETYRDIRIDFDLDRVKVSKSNDVYVINVSGEIKIPGLYRDECKGYSKQSSIEHLETIATELGLGFATNLESTDDSMVHFLANENRFSLIDRIVRHSYIKETSFQDWAIDPYYNLNFIDIESVLNSQRELEDGFFNLKFNPIFIESGEGNDNLNQIQGKLFLSNSKELSGTNLYIAEHRVINSANKIVKKKGYRTLIRYFENDSDENLVEFEINPNVTLNLEDTHDGLGKKNNEERFKIENKIRYLGRQDNGLEDSNVHLNYLYATTIAEQNMVELEKIKLEVTLDSFNPALHLYQFIPVQMRVYNSPEIIKVQQREEVIEQAGLSESTPKTKPFNPSELESAVDPKLSGFYMIKGIKYIYNEGTGFLQRLILTRREWPVV